LAWLQADWISCDVQERALYECQQAVQNNLFNKIQQYQQNYGKGLVRIDHPIAEKNNKNLAAIRKDEKKQVVRLRNA
jgi:hypothetical protein